MQLALLDGFGLGAVSSSSSGAAEGVGVAPPGVVSGRVYSGTVPRVGVGSNRVHPTPSKYSSGQACASWRFTSTLPSPRSAPGAKPTATRAGMPSERAMAAIAKEKWTQKP